MTGFQHPDNGPYLLNNATTAGHQTVDLGSAPVKYVMCENKTPPLTEGFVGWAGNCFQLPAWRYTAHGLFVVFCFSIPALCLFCMEAFGSSGLQEISKCCCATSSFLLCLLDHHLYSAAGHLVTKEHPGNIIKKTEKEKLVSCHLNNSSLLPQNEKKIEKQLLIGVKVHTILKMKTRINPAATPLTTAKLGSCSSTCTHTACGTWGESPRMGHGIREPSKQGWLSGRNMSGGLQI